MSEPKPEQQPRLGALLPYLRQLRGLGGWYAASLVLGLLTVASTVALLALSGWFISAAAVAGLTPATALAFNFFYPGASVRGLALSRTVGRWSERVLTHEATFRLLARVRVWLLARLLPLAPRQLGVYHGAELLHRFMRDVEQLDGLIPRLLLPGISLFLVLGGVAGLLGFWIPAGALPPLALIGLFLLLPPLLWRLGRRGARGLVERRAALRRAMIDAADGAPVLAFNGRAWGEFRDRALARSREAMQVQGRNDRLAALARALVTAAAGLAAWWALVAHGGTLDGPLLVAMVLLLLGVAEIAAPLAGGLVELPAIAHAAGRIEAIAGQEPAIVFAPAGPQPADGGLEIEQLDFSWDAHTPVLRDFSLHLAPGTRLFLEGPSGCGKSSLVQLLARFEVPDRGSIRLGGVPLEALDEPTLRRTLAVASQFAWARGGTLADNLRLAAPAASAAEMWEVLELVGLAATLRTWPEGLETWVQEGGQSLSGGQLRRLGVARALLRRAPLTVLDEPTEGLEDGGAERLVQQVCAWCQGRSLIWISHRPQGSGCFDQALRLTPPGA